MGLRKLRTHFGRFEDKRNLCGAYDMFFTDDGILLSLTKPLGKVFFAKKKQPIPVRFVNGSARECIARARDSTHMFLSRGPCLAVKIAHTNMEIDHIVENIVKGIQNCVQKIPQKWGNIQSIHVKVW